MSFFITKVKFFFISFRRIIQSFISRYFFWDKYWTEKRLERRKDRQNKYFKWTNENIQKIKELNNYLSELMEDVYSECEKIKNQFDKWISEGKSCYKNYEITGYIIFNETDCEKCGVRMNNFSDSRDEALNDKAWTVHFIDRKNIKNELDKDVQMKNPWYWKDDFIENLEKHGIKNPCRYMNDLLNNNVSFSLKDFVKMSERNFCKHVEVSFCNV